MEGLGGIPKHYLVLGALGFLIYQSGSLWPMLYMALFMFVFIIGQLIWNQESMLYVPDPMQGMLKPEDNPVGFRSPAEFRMKHDDVFFKAADGVQIHAWWIPGVGPEKGRTTLLFCHANAGNIGMRLPNFVELANKCNCNVLAFDYRGFGKSEGYPSEPGLVLDGLAAMQELKVRFKCDEVFIFGRSLGGAVAIAICEAVQNYAPETQANYPRISGVICENTFTSISDLADKLFPFLQYLAPVKAAFLRIHWDSLSRIKTLSKSGTRMLFLVGEKDELVPPEHSERLRAACPGEATIVKFPDGMHNDTYQKGGKRYWTELQDFFQKGKAQQQ